MFKDVLNHANLSLYAQVGLLIFFLVFAAVVVRTIFRTRGEITRWAKLPLDEFNNPGEQDRS
ncbi:MAG TPA: hypothetical protein PLD59_17295 [Tepidisphaeraceae bacterium]|nr:hypothetical protein [Tepidisphaeraceae bacterium]